jgi:hypothetical protein
MRIKLSKKRLYTNLLLGVIWILFGMSYFIFEATMPWSGYAYSILGTLYLAHFLYDYKHQYLIIENGKIQKNILYSFKNKIELSEIDEIKSIKGNYILKSETRNLSIDPSLIDKQSLIKLLHVLRQVDLPSEKNHFKKYKPELK